MSDNPIVPEVPNWSNVPPQGPPQVPPTGPAQQFPQQPYPPEQFDQQQYGQQQYQPQQYGQPYPPQQWAPPVPPAAGGYQQYGYAPGANAVLNPFESKGTTILVLGILSLVVCQILGPVAFFMGRSLKNEAEAAGWPEPGNGKAGRICGLVATCLVAFFILFYVVFFIALGVASTGSSS